MDETTREDVRRRAAGRCEYCLLPEAHVLTPFQIEHVVARQHRGGDTLGNLHKGPNLTGIDPETRELTKLFNPRRHKWRRHFRSEGAALVGKTAVGRTTVEVLAMNESARIALREELMEQGLYPPG